MRGFFSPLLVYGLLEGAKAFQWAIPVAFRGDSAIALTQGSTATMDPVTPYLDEFDFCLDARDSGLSGPSDTKSLNSITNQVIKNILIMNSPEDAEAAERELNALRMQYSAQPSTESGAAFLDVICALGEPAENPTEDQVKLLDSEYQVAYERVIRVLGNFGCEVAFGDPGRVVPADANMCLSVLDEMTDESTKTKVLNSITNRVCRTMCVGNDDDLQRLAKEMENKQKGVMKTWIGEGWEDTMEDRYYQSLVNLLKNGLSVGEIR
ncbi:unnamed protein product [Chrysoparadoxa australica]